jgi:hypothetical protein
MKVYVALLAAGLAVTACSQSTGGSAAEPPPPAPEPEVQTLDAIGVYDFSTSVEGQTVTGTFTISGEPGAYTGSMSSSMFGTMPLRDIAVDGMDLSFLVDLPDATVAIFLTFEADSYTGEWDAEGMTGFISGSKR